MARDAAQPALAHFRDVLAIYDRCAQPPVAKVLESRHGLATALSQAGEHDEATRLFDAVVAERREIHGQDHQSVAVVLHDLAAAHDRAGDRPRAIATYESAIAMRRRVLDRPDESGDVAQSLMEIGRIHTDSGAIDAAIAALSESARIFRA